MDWKYAKMATLFRLVHCYSSKTCALETLNGKIHNLQSDLLCIVFRLVFNFRRAISELPLFQKLQLQESHQTTSININLSSFSPENPRKYPGFPPCFQCFSAAREAHRDWKASKAILLKALEEASEALETQEVRSLVDFFREKNGGKHHGLPGKNADVPRNPGEK